MTRLYFITLLGILTIFSCSIDKNSEFDPTSEYNYLTQIAVFKRRDMSSLNKIYQYSTITFGGKTADAYVFIGNSREQHIIGLYHCYVLNENHIRLTLHRQETMLLEHIKQYTKSHPAPQNIDIMIDKNKKTLFISTGERLSAY